MRWRWPPWRRPDDVTGEALEHLAKLEQRDPEVARLGAELRARQRQNNFSGLVQQAIRRSAHEGH